MTLGSELLPGVWEGHIHKRRALWSYIALCPQLLPHSHHWPKAWPPKPRAVVPYSLLSHLPCPRRRASPPSSRWQKEARPGWAGDGPRVRKMVGNITGAASSSKNSLSELEIVECWAGRYLKELVQILHFIDTKNEVQRGKRDIKMNLNSN